MKRTALDGTVTEGTPEEFAAYDAARSVVGYAPIRLDPVVVPFIPYVPTPTIIPEWVPTWQIICDGGIP